MARISKATPCSRGYPHREHRAKQGRKYWPEKPFSITRKKKIEQLKNRDHETEERASDW
jgi:hypothetical protein